MKKHLPKEIELIYPIYTSKIEISGSQKVSSLPRANNWENKFHRNSFITWPSQKTSPILDKLAHLSFTHS